MRVVGRSLPRIDGRLKVTGQMVYGVDFVMPGMLYGWVVRSSHPHARIRRVDVTAARAVPGVVAIIAGEDIPGRHFGGLIKDATFFAIERVRFVGQPVAAIAATSPEAADEAVRRVFIEYESLPSVDDPNAALSGEAPLVHDAWASYPAHPNVLRQGNRCGMASILKGDPERAFAQADYVFEDRFSTEPVHQAYLEPRAALAVWDRSGILTVYSNTQLPFEIQRTLAEILEIPVGRIRVIVTGIGGGFGGKLLLGVEHIAALLAQRTDRPVKVVMTMEEEFLAGYPRPAVSMTVRTAVRGDGTILAKDTRAVFDAGAFSGYSPVMPSAATLVLAGPYRIAHLRVEVQAVYTHRQNFGPYRAPMGPQCNFACESQMDMIARRLGLDSLEFRLRNIVRDGDEGPTGQLLTSVGLDRALRSVAEAIGWGTPAGPHRGKGIACGWWTTTGGPSGVYVKLHPDGSVTLATGCAEIGTGALTGAAQVLAEELGIELDDITIVSADTFATPYDHGAQGSRTAFNVGNAARRAAADIRQQLLSLAAQILEAHPNDVELWNRRVAVKGAPSQSIEVGELVKVALQRGGGILAAGTFAAPPTVHNPAYVRGHFYPAFHSPSFHAHAAEVEVDPETGELRVTRYVVAQDVGFALNPRLIEGQIEGGVAQGLGQALFEQIPYAHGQPLVHNFTDYALPTIADIPAVESILIESPSEVGPFGAKGVGEPPIIEPPATIANALEDAIGVRVTSLPITPEKVFQALQSPDSSARRGR